MKLGPKFAQVLGEGSWKALKGQELTRSGTRGRNSIQQSELGKFQVQQATEISSMFENFPVCWGPSELSGVSVAAR